MKVHSETRPWGRLEKFHENKPCTVKMIYVSANSRLSLQYHDKRSEFWKVIKGTAMVESATTRPGTVFSTPSLR